MGTISRIINSLPFIIILAVILYFLLGDVWNNDLLGGVVVVLVLLFALNSRVRCSLSFRAPLSSDSVIYVVTAALVLSSVSQLYMTTHPSIFILVSVEMVAISVTRIYYCRHVEVESECVITLSDILDEDIEDYQYGKSRLFISDRETDRNSIYPQSFIDSMVETVESSLSIGGVNIGVLGDWGSGKSSAVNIVAKALEKKGDVVYIHFRPWMYGDNTPLLEALIGEISDKVGIPFFESASNRRELVNAIIGSEPRLLSWLRFFRSVPKPDAVRRYKELVRAALEANGKKLLICVDDLDRCDDRAHDFLMALMTDVFNFDHMTCVFVYSSHLKDSYGMDDFLQKIITTEIRMPTLDVDVVSKIFGTCVLKVVYAGREAADVDIQDIRMRVGVLAPLLSTPRDIVNILNASIPDYRNNTDLDLLDIAYLKMLELKYPQIFEKVVRHRGLAQKYVAAYDRKTDEEEREKRRLIAEGFGISEKDPCRGLLVELMPGLFNIGRYGGLDLTGHKEKKRFSNPYCTEQYFSWGWDDRRNYEKCLRELHTNSSYEENVDSLGRILDSTANAQTVFFREIQDEDFGERTGIVVAALVGILPHLSKDAFMVASPHEVGIYSVAKLISVKEQAFSVLKIFIGHRKYWADLCTIVHNCGKISDGNKDLENKCEELLIDLGAELSKQIESGHSMYSDEDYLGAYGIWRVQGLIGSSDMERIELAVKTGTTREKIRFCWDMILQGYSFTANGTKITYNFNKSTKLSFPENYFSELAETVDQNELSPDGRIVLDICVTRSPYESDVSLDPEELKVKPKEETSQ